MKADFYQRLKDKLNDSHKFPCIYMYKFIIPKDQENKIKLLFSDSNILTKQSSKGNYISVTIKLIASNSNEVIKNYKKASKIEGLIAL